MAIYKDGQEIRRIAYQEEATGKAINISEVWFSDGIYELTDADDNMPLLDDDGEVFQDDSQNYPLLIFQYDIDAPELTVTTPAGMASTSPSYTASASYLVSGTVADADSGVRAVYVNGNEAVISGTAWSYTISLNADTATAVSVYAIDNAGNVTETIVRYVMYDTIAPTLSVTAPTGTSSSSPTYQTTSSLTVSGTASDSGSGIKNVTVNGNTASGTTSWSYTLTLSGNTTTTITVVATDNVGRTTTVTRYAMYDSAAPTLTVTAPTSTSSSSPTYTTSSSYTVSGTASDTGSGIKSVTVNGYTCSGTTSWSYSLSLSANSTTTVTIIATDNAGRTTTVTRYVMYDSAVPTLSVTQPTGTSSSSPTYKQSDSSTTYTVSGTASDTGSGIASVTVNGYTASGTTSWSYTLSSLAINTTHTITIIATDNAGRTTTATRYLKVEAYYNYAARTAGVSTTYSSLSALLSASSTCTTIAGSSSARSTMTSNYQSSMVSYIDDTSVWNTGFNYLNFKCGLKCYLYHAGNQCSDVSGGWSYTFVSGNSSDSATWGSSYATFVHSTVSGYTGYTSDTLNSSSSQSCNAPYYIYTKSKITGFTKLGGYFKITSDTNSRNVGGFWFFGTVSATAALSYSNRVAGTSATIGSGSQSATIVDASSSARTVTLSSSSSAYVELAGAPPLQLGGGSATHTVTLYNVYIS